MTNLKSHYSGNVVKSTSRERLGWLDEVRGIAALMVLLGHYRVLFAGSNITIHAIDMLPRGVQLFYILSGYIMWHIYEDSVNSLSGWITFLVKRVFRIVPLFVILIIVYSICLGDKVPNQPKNFLFHLMILPFGMVQEFINSIVGVEWSIYVESWYYIFYPLIAACVSKQPAIAVLLSLVLQIGQLIVLSALGCSVQTKTFWYMQPTGQIIYFVLGMVLAKNRGAKYISNAKLKLIMIISTVAFILIPSLTRSFAVQLGIGSIYFCLILRFYTQLEISFCVAGIFRWLGERSYSIYLIHMLPIHYATANGWQGGFVWSLLIVLVLIGSNLTYSVIELPFIRVGRNLMNPIKSV